MKFKYILLLLYFPFLLHASSTIKGAGATLAAPLFYSWAYYFYQEKKLEVRYESIGSFSGINKLKLDSVDFVSSDKPLQKMQLDQYNLVQFPVLSTTITIVHNIQGVKNDQLKLSAQLLADIFLGKITNWNDKKIQALNPSLQLPNTKITVITREGKSGTSYYFTKFLSNNSKKWKETIGITKELILPHSEYANGNEGVSMKLSNIPNSIGYIPSPYSIANKLSTVLIQNQQGEWITSKNTNYPLVLVNYSIVSKNTLQKNKNLIEFFQWIYNKGNIYALELGYLPLDKKIKNEFFNRVLKIKD